MIIDLEGNVIDVTSKLARGGWRKTYDFVISFFGIIDLLSILPFYLNFFFLKPFTSARTSDPIFGHAKHALRVVRTWKLLRYR
jgi:hypothetical protein